MPTPQPEADPKKASEQRPPEPAPKPEKTPPPATPRGRRGVQRRFRHEPHYQPMPAHDETLPWFIETALPHPRYEDADKPRVSRAARHQEEVARFLRFRADPFSSWVSEPRFFWQLVLLILLTLALLVFVYVAWTSPPQRYS